MRFVRPLAFVLSALALSTTAFGKLWIVDANSGPGTDFTDLPDAVNVASDGDVIRVRAGLYTGVTVSKAITILGDANANVASNPFGLGPGLVVDGIPAGKNCVIKGITSNWYSAGTAMSVTNCQGRVILDRVVSESFSTFSFGIAPALTIADSPHVFLTDCRLFGAPGIQASDSAVALKGSIVRGHDGWSGHGFAPAHEALQAVRSDVSVTGGIVKGGNGTQFFPQPSSPAVVSTDSDVLLNGDALMSVRAGDMSPTPVPALLTSGGTLEYDPNISLQSAAGSPHVVGTAMVEVKRLPALQASGTAVGGTVVVDLFSPQGELLGLFESLPANPIPLPPHGTLYINLNLFFIMALGTQGVSEHWPNLLPVPPDPGLVGLTVVLQGSSGGIFEPLQLTNPVYIVLD